MNEKYEINEQVIRFLVTSNQIEQEDSGIALENAVLAWNCALQHFRYLGKRRRCRPGIVSDPILDIHNVLMRRLNPRIAGKVRDCEVYIGGNLCPFTTTIQIEQDLTAWHGKHALAGTEEKIKEAHVAFEHLHPFEDGNGRVGRIIMNAQRVCAGLSILVINPGKEQAEYYRWF